MQISNRQGVQINSLPEWKEHGSPASAGHWKPGRSAYELARDWSEGDAREDVEALLRLRPELADVKLTGGVAEKKTHFDEEGRGPRNHDLLVTGSVGEASVTVGVEGKADETFDAPVGMWRDRAVAANAGSGAPARIDRLTNAWFQTTIDADQEKPPLREMGYQLFSALAGTLADARQDDSAYAVLLVMEYVTDETKDAKHQVNAAAIDAFLERLAGKNLERHQTPAGWVTGPVMVEGDGVWTPSLLPVFFAKLVRHRRTPA